jgi:lipopolysaccharide transport system permease protein
LDKKVSPPAKELGKLGEELPVTVIERRPGWHLVDFRELWRYRELLGILIWRDIKVRYKQTVLGAAWAVLQPLATMIVFSAFFGRVAGVPSGGISYPLFVLAGLIPWFLFSNTITSASQSVIASQSLITKVYFPRLLIPLGAVGPHLVDGLIAFGMLLLMMLCYGVLPGWGLFAAMTLLLGVMLAALGVGVLLAALSVAYRDFRYVIPFMLQLWMFTTPTIYMQAEVAGGPWARLLLPLNPAYGLILNFRAAALGGDFDLYGLGVSTVVSLVFLVVGSLYFRRVERGFADSI